MKKLLTKILSLVLILIGTSSCDWVYLRETCPYGFQLQLTYKYNLLNADAVYQVNDAQLYLFDEQGLLVRQVSVDSAELHARQHLIPIDGLQAGTYTFVVWSGSRDSHYDCATLQEGVSTLPDMMLRLRPPYADNSSELLQPLFYGCKKIEVTGEDLQTETLDLMKDTNTFHCLIQPSEEGVEIQADEYDIEVVAANSAMDHANAIATAALTYYRPYQQNDEHIEDADLGKLPAALYDLSTLRLMEGDNTRLRLYRHEDNTLLYDIALTEVVSKFSYDSYGRKLPTQEYLDRQDNYPIVFYMDRLGNVLEVVLAVRSWVVIPNETEF